MSDKPLMEKLLREHEIDIVISAVGGATILDQITLVDAITAVGTIKVLFSFFFCSGVRKLIQRFVGAEVFAVGVWARCGQS